MDADRDQRLALTIILVDPEGQTSAVAAAARRAGHRPVVVTGLDTAAIVLGTMTPDLIVVRSTTPQADRDAVARLTACASEVPIRLIGHDAPLGDALDGGSVPLN